jgi:hypothetical protein
MDTHQSKLNSCLRDVWQRKQNLNIVSGSLAFLRWSVFLFLCGMFIDWWFFMPTTGRVVIFLILFVVSIVMAWRGGWSQLRSFNARNTALQIEQSLGDCNSLLVTAVQFGKPDVEHGTSAKMMEHACKQAEEKVATFTPQKVISFSPLKSPLIIILFLSLVIGVFAAISTDFLGAGLSRIFPPWLAVKYPTRTTVELKSEHLVIKEGSEALIQAQITGEIPKNATISLRTKIGKPRVRNLKITEGVCEYKIKSAYRDFEYRILAGDDRSDWQKVTVIAAPRIKKAEVALTYPAYTKRAKETIDALTLTLPEGTKAVWTLFLDRAVSEASVITSTGKPQALVISGDGMLVTMEQVADSSRSYKFTWKEKSKGYEFTSPSNYLQVKPDEEPQVEITKPEKNIYATLGRKLDIAYRARDDHGIGEAYVGYRINKNEEKKIKIPLPTHENNSEKTIDWDYRKTLNQLKIGDTVSFLFEMADRYPGKEGPHRIRTQARRLSILSERDYLKRIRKQRKRLLTQVKNIYREERGVHMLVKEFEPNSDSFIQTCQLEVVRQELIKERLLQIKQSMGKLVEDLVANNFTDKKYTEEFTFLQSEIQRIADNYISLVSTKLKGLSSYSEDKNSKSNLIEAIDAVNFAARELGVMVLQLGFKEATEIIAREIHTISEDQATLRLQSILSGDTKNSTHQTIAKRQNDLADWLKRLFKEIPKDRESSEDDAIVAFKLSRLIKELKRASTEETMRKASQSISNADSKNAAVLQAEVIRVLLAAEFKLRSGLEHTALVKAREVFNTQVDAQKDLRETISSLDAAEFNERKDEVRDVQQILSKRLTLLLMPAMIAPRYTLLDSVQLPKPPVAKYLAESEANLKAIAKAIDSGDKNKTIVELSKAEKTFTILAGFVTTRLESLSEAATISATAAMAGSQMSKLGSYEEQLLGILEKTEDAEADKTDAVYIAALQDRLSLDLQKFKSSINKMNQRLTKPSKGVKPVLNYIETTIQASKLAAMHLKNNKPTEAIDQQTKIIEIFEEIVALLTAQSGDIAAYAGASSAASIAGEPGPLMLDIKSEQVDMVRVAEATKTDDLPSLAIAQKNLVHAVNASLTYLDPFAHHIETGSVMLFAKTDMDAAAEALTDKDKEEAVDAGSFVAESLQKILDQMDELMPQYTYVLEITEFIHNRLSESITISALQKQLSEKVLIASDKASIAKYELDQETLLNRSRLNTEILSKVIQKGQFNKSTIYLEAALKLLKTGDGSAASEQMNLAVDAMTTTNELLIKTNTLLVLVLAPPLTPIVPPQMHLIIDFTSLATHNKILYRKTHLASAKDAKNLSIKQAELAKQCDQFIKRLNSLSVEYIATKAAQLKKLHARIRNPTTSFAEESAKQEKGFKVFFNKSANQLKLAYKSMLDASDKLKSGSLKEATLAQSKSTELLRSFYIDSILMFMTVPGPPPPQDPATSYDISTEDTMEMMGPGSVSGKKVKGGSLEWEVLGRRDRAALNENFARELPLEYRGLLKNYYERLAQ